MNESCLTFDKPNNPSCIVSVITNVKVVLFLEAWMVLVEQVHVIDDIIRIWTLGI